MAKKNFRTDLVTGYFDVKIYNATKPREQWLTKQNGDSITFVVSLGEKTPEWTNGNIKSYTDKKGNPRQIAKVKIGASCIFYNENKERINRPDNNDLDGKRFEAFIVGTDLGQNADNKASGLWANAIMLREVQVEQFGDCSFDDNATYTHTQYTPQAAAAGAARQPVRQPAAIPPTKAADELPF